uniref:Replication-associated protein n=1 Tax=Sewage-associated circular DNA molecule TaxID=1592207 RepID=A0A0B4UGP7_9VIRU|nr:replication-associated protein [Sewage-associated circular DNA molecule]
MAPEVDRASMWSITINNPTDADRQALKAHPSFVKMVKYQDEIGDEGTLHIQGAVQTTQVRFSAMKKWLARAHIEIARNKQALLNYVEKSETAVSNTQVVVQADYLSMDAALKEIAKYAQDYVQWHTALKRPAKDKEFEKQEFWTAVRQILREKPKAVGLFTNPQLERAWINTRSVWIELCEKDRQTDRQTACQFEELETNSIVYGTEEEFQASGASSPAQDGVPQ